MIVVKLGHSLASLDFGVLVGCYSFTRCLEGINQLTQSQSDRKNEKKGGKKQIVTVTNHSIRPRRISKLIHMKTGSDARQTIPSRVLCSPVLQ